MHLTSSKLSKQSKKMEVVEGKPNNKKIVFAQEIAFAKVLAGNNKTLRDRGIKKLKKWLEVRGNGKWAFTEEEFIRISTGLFYCMWMSDKFLVQEELAENISQLIHCFKKSSHNALLFIRTFNKRLLMEYEQLDQYRIDKFNMLVRRVLRQTFVYCKRKNWDENILKKVMSDMYEIVLHRDSALGFVIHFLNVYLEELAKVSNGKIDHKKVLILLEPYVKLLGSTKDDRILSETEQFFFYLMRQSDPGIEFDEKFNAWKKLGFPGSGPHLLKKEPASVNDVSSDEDFEEVDDEEIEKPLDPRAGSVHVNLPQIPIDFDGIINLFKKYEYGKQTTAKGRRKIRILIQKFSSLKKGKFPMRIKKDLILDEKPKKNKQTLKNAKMLMEFTKKLDDEPIKTEEFLGMKKLLENQEEEVDDDSEREEEDDNDEPIEFESDNLEDGSEGEEEEEEEEEENTVIEENEAKNKYEATAEKVVLSENKAASKTNRNNQQIKKVNNNNSGENNNIKFAIDKKAKKKVKKKKRKQNEKKMNGENVQNEINSSTVSALPKKKKLKKKVEERKPLVTVECPKEASNKNSPNQVKIEKFVVDDSCEENNFSVETQKNVGNKRKILSDWQVQDLDENSTTYKRIKPQRVSDLGVKSVKVAKTEEETKATNGDLKEESKESEETHKKLFIPTFWDRAKAKVNTKKKANDKKTFLNPFSKVNGNSVSSAERRISFALERNMAQENEEYLEEVRNSPKVPFDGSKRPVQSALKSGLIPSPINPFYRFKKIKF